MFPPAVELPSPAQSPHPALDTCGLGTSAELGLLGLCFPSVHSMFLFFFLLSGPAGWQLSFSSPSCGKGSTCGLFSGSQIDCGTGHAYLPGWGPEWTLALAWCPWPSTVVLSGFHTGSAEEGRKGWGESQRLAAGSGGPRASEVGLDIWSGRRWGREVQVP